VGEVADYKILQRVVYVENRQRF